MFSAQKSGTPPQLSVVVPTYNRAPLLRKTLTSLVQQRNPPPFEVVVADDGSADDSEQVTAEFRAGLSAALPTVTLAAQHNERASNRAK